MVSDTVYISNDCFSYWAETKCGTDRQMYGQGIKRKNLTIVDVTDEKQRY